MRTAIGWKWVETCQRAWCTVMVLSVFAVGGALAAADYPATPGSHKDLACDGAPALTYHIHLPTGYPGADDVTFPVLFISSPGGNPGFMKLESWANANEVVLVTINDSKNGEWEPIMASQKAVTGTVFAHYKLHPFLRFAMGFSGSAWASMELAGRYKDNWAGVIVSCHSSGGDGIPKHVYLAYFTGIQDSTHSNKAVLGAAKSWESKGNPVRIISREGGHEWAQTEETIGFLDWMVGMQRICHPKLPPAEAKAALAKVHERADAAAQMTDAKTRLAEYNAILAIDPYIRTPSAKDTMAAWVETSATIAANESDPIKQYREYEAMSRSMWIRAASSDRKKELKESVKTLLKNKDVKEDADSRNALAKVQAMEDKAGSAKGALKDAAMGYAQIAKRWPDTEAGKEARQHAERLAKDL